MDMTMLQFSKSLWDDIQPLGYIAIFCWSMVGLNYAANKTKARRSRHYKMVGYPQEVVRYSSLRPLSMLPVRTMAYGTGNYPGPHQEPEPSPGTEV